MEGKPDFVTVNEHVDFSNKAEFVAQNNGKFQNNNFAAVWTGKIPIYEGGEYEFSTKSDDGSRMFVDGEKVVDNWGLHGATEVKATAKLVRGYHDIKVEFFEKGGGASCLAKYKGADTGDEQKWIEGWHDPSA